MGRPGRRCRRRPRRTLRLEGAVGAAQAREAEKVYARSISTTRHRRHARGQDARSKVSRAATAAAGGAGDAPHLLVEPLADRSAARAFRAARATGDAPDGAATSAHRSTRRWWPARTRTPPGAAAQAGRRHLQIPDDMAWMFNFEAACDAGMALRVDLTDEQAATASTGWSCWACACPIRRTRDGRTWRACSTITCTAELGLEILPQGTPTNNTESEGARLLLPRRPGRQLRPLLPPGPSSTRSKPTRCCAATGSGWRICLGLRHELVQRIPHAGRPTSSKPGRCRSRCGRARWAI